MHDVIVAGGGPVGSRIAFKLAEAGHSVLVLEKKKRIGGRVCCAGIVGQECVEYSDIDNDVILRRANSASIFSPSGRLLRLQREETQACILDRAAFDLSMAERARAAGAEYVFNCTARDAKTKTDGISVEASAGYGKVQYSARVLVIATGFGSRLVQRVGLGKARDFVIGAQAEVKTESIEETEVYTGRQVAPSFFGWLVPIGEYKALAGLLSRSKPKEYLKKLLSGLKADGKIAGDDVVIDCRGITLKPLQKTYGRRLIVVGDAAGQVKPTTGGGIYFGLLAADIAAESLTEALYKDDLSAGSLAAYQKKWRKMLANELRVGYWARRLFERLSDKQIEKIIDITIDSGLQRRLLEANDISFDWHGRAIGRALRQSTLSGALAAMKMPFRTGLK